MTPMETGRTFGRNPWEQASLLPAQDIFAAEKVAMPPAQYFKELERVKSGEFAAALRKTLVNAVKALAARYNLDAILTKYEAAQEQIGAYKLTFKLKGLEEPEAPQVNPLPGPGEAAPVPPQETIVPKTVAKAGIAQYERTTAQQKEPLAAAQSTESKEANTEVIPAPAEESEQRPEKQPLTAAKANKIASKETNPAYFRIPQLNSASNLTGPQSLPFAGPYREEQKPETTDLQEMMPAGTTKAEDVSDSATEPVNFPLPSAEAAAADNSVLIPGVEPDAGSVQEIALPDFGFPEPLPSEITDSQLPPADLKTAFVDNTAALLHSGIGSGVEQGTKLQELPLAGAAAKEMPGPVSSSLMQGPVITAAGAILPGSGSMMNTISQAPASIGLGAAIPVGAIGVSSLPLAA